jgi:DNA-binding ferritin-like protein
MSLQNLHDVLERVYATNFVAYQRAHASHMNVRGRNFMSDHKLLGKIYEYLEANIDILGEEIQACGVGRVPENISAILDNSIIMDNVPEMDADSLLMDTLDNLYIMIDVYHEMDEAGREANYPDVSNMAADHIQNIATFCWKIEATLEIDGRHTDTGRNQEESYED